MAPTMDRAPRERALSRASIGLSLLGAAVLWGAKAQAQGAGAEATQTAEEAMQGGGMTEERQLDDAAAREHFRVATRYYDEGRFADAATQFEEAFELSGRAELLYNAYIAHREANQSPGAAAMLEQYLRLVPDAPDRVNLEARLAQLQQSIAQNAEQQAALEEARARAEREAAARRQAESQGEAWPWVILGVGAAALIGGAITGPLALAESSDLRAQCDAEGLCDPSIDIDGRRSNAKGLALAADVLLIGGGTVAAVGLVLGLIFGLPGGDAEEANEEGVTATASCGLTGCAAVVQGRFQ